MRILVFRRINLVMNYCALSGLNFFLLIFDGLCPSLMYFAPLGLQFFYLPLLRRPKAGSSPPDRPKDYQRYVGD